jgi:hypothetical protein
LSILEEDPNVTQASHQIAHPERGSQFSTPGIILLVASIFEVFGMLHHPSLQTPDISHAVDEIARLATVSADVHAALIALMLLIAYGFADFAVRRGFNRALVRAGAICYATGIAFMTVAALVSGFVVSSLTSVVPHVTQIDLQINFQVLMLCKVLNQVCATFAVVMMSAGIVSWSLDLVRDSGLNRGVGMFGVLVGFLSTLVLIVGNFHLDVHGMTTVVAVQAAWNMAIAALMQRGELGG